MDTIMEKLILWVTVFWYKSLLHKLNKYDRTVESFKEAHKVQMSLTENTSDMFPEEITFMRKYNWITAEAARTRNLLRFSGVDVETLDKIRY